MPKNTDPEFLSPYEITLIDGVYRFTTSLGRTYSCLFTDLSHYFSPFVSIYEIEIFLFDFFHDDQKATSKNESSEKISITIKLLLDEFFVKSNIRVLIFICDNYDGRGFSRNVLFKKWFKGYSDKFDWDTIEFNMNNSDVIHGAIIRRKKFQYYEILKSEVIDSIEGLMIEKFGQ